MDVTIRRMQLSDLEQVHAIDVLSFTLPWSERSFKFELTENPVSRLWVAEALVDGAPLVVGMIAVWMIIDEAHIGTIAVHPDYRRMGIGRRLLAAALLDAHSAGARQAFLEVRRGNEPAKAMYFEFGFVVTGVRPGYYRDNYEDALLLTLTVLEPEVLHRFM